MKNLSTTANRFFLARIVARKLFGHFDYDLDLSSRNSGPNRLAILYGDNGSGKTTLLKMVFHLLSPVDNKGHKSVLAKIKFQRFEVALADGTTISAQRAEGKITGDFRLRISNADKKIAETALPVGRDGSVKMAGTPEEAAVKRFLQALQKLNLEVLFMRDDRRLTSNLDADSNAEEGGDLAREMYLNELSVHRMAALTDGRRLSPLNETVENVNQYFRRRAQTASSRGEVDTNKIYGSLIKQLVLPRRGSSLPDVDEFGSYMKRMELVAARNREFVKVGLTSPLLAEGIIRTLKRAKPATWPAVSNVLRPYIDSVEARLAALDPIRKVIDQFVEAINSFIGVGKAVNFSLENGLQIQTYDGSTLLPESMSSGEKQLLTMFCHIISVRDRPAVFIIDEPELSLNVKWQRRLIQSLLDCTADASIQFIMASHSMELLARHREHVVSLKNTAA